MKAHPGYVAAMHAHDDCEECVTICMQGPGCAIKVENGQSLSRTLLGYQDNIGLLFLLCYTCTTQFLPGQTAQTPFTYHLNSIIIKVPPGIFWRSAACAIAVVTVTSWPLLVIV